MGNSGSSSAGKECVFCKICRESEGSKILTENEKMVIFSDINPAAKHHYLIVPKEHMPNPKNLHTRDDIDFIGQMIEFGTDYLKEQGGEESDMKIGFHWPPFNSIEHLHLHVIYPASEMGVMYRMMYSGAVFVNPEYVTDRIKGKL